MAPVEADWLHVDDTERVVWSGHATRMRLLPAFLVGVITVAVGFVLFRWGIETRYEAAGVAGLGLSVVAYRYLQWRTTVYVATDERLYAKTGILRLRVDVIRYDRIQNTGFSQSTRARLLGYGTVVCYTSGTGGEDVGMDAVPRPTGIAELIQAQLNDDPLPERFVDRPAGRSRGYGSAAT